MPRQTFESVLVMCGLGLGALVAPSPFVVWTCIAVIAVQLVVGEPCDRNCC